MQPAWRAHEEALSVAGCADGAGTRLSLCRLSGQLAALLRWQEKGLTGLLSHLGAELPELVRTSQMLVAMSCTAVTLHCLWHLHGVGGQCDCLDSGKGS